MENSNLFADAGMLIRKPVEDVFQAFINPEITTKFWFTRSSDKLVQGKKVTWYWDMYNHSIDVSVKKIILNKSILIEWGNRGQTTKVEWKFKQLDKSKTFVSVVNTGFKGTTDEIISGIRDSTGGFSWVLAGLKAYLEYDIQLNLIGDRYPKELGNH